MRPTPESNEAGTRCELVRPQIQTTTAAFSTTTSDAVKALPMTGSIKRQILDAMRAGQKLTSLDGLARFGTSRLAALVFQLRAAGWRILSEDIVVETAHGRTAHVAEYFIDEGAR